jgi:exosortase E/protease (VPEID-CTERM system)
MQTPPITAIALRERTFALPSRLAIMAAIFIADKILLNQFVDFDRAQIAAGLGAWLRSAQHWGFRFIVAFVAAVMLFAWVQGGPRIEAAAAALRTGKLRLRFMLLHGLLILALIPLSYWLYRDDAAPLPLLAIAIVWVGLALGAAWSIVLTFAPPEAWAKVLRSLGVIWPYAAIAAVVGAGAMQLSQLLWAPTTAITFSLVRLVLLPFLPALNADVGARTLGTDRFEVLITDECSGLEGLGLVLAFCTAWLVHCRHEYRFPHALLVIPVGLAAIFVLNILRIAALVLIGTAGYPDVAVFGFHSQAGWIAFNAVACGLVYVSRRSAWLNREAATRPQAATPWDSASAPASVNPTAAFLMPLLALLAAGSVSHALSGTFERCYPLRLLAGLAALWMYRRNLARLDWRCGWRAAGVGIAVFVVWMMAAHRLSTPASLPDSLAAMSPGTRDLWLSSRIVNSVLVVPVAEELAYRGYLMRRFINPDFESVPFHAVRCLPLLAAALCFGLAHGALWLPGSLAGIAYGGLVIRTGRMGDAALAHVVTNAGVAFAVMYYGQWQLW